MSPEPSKHDRSLVDFGSLGSAEQRTRLTAMLFVVGLVGLLSVMMLDPLDIGSDSRRTWSIGFGEDDAGDTGLSFNYDMDEDPDTDRREEAGIALMFLCILFLVIWMSLYMLSLTPEEEAEKKAQTAKELDRKRWHKIAQVDEALERLVERDPIWDKMALAQFVEHLFLRFQEAWTENDREFLALLMNTELYERWEELLDRMEREDQRNRIEEARIVELQFIDLYDHTDDSLDSFTAKIVARVVDYTVNQKGSIVKPQWRTDQEANYEKKSTIVVEHWSFIRRGITWILKDVTYSDKQFLGMDVVMSDTKYKTGKMREEKDDQDKEASEAD